MEYERPFLAQYLYSCLTSKHAGDSIERIGETLFNAKINLTPHQIEAALFAFKSPLNKGCVLADEVGLGKTIEAGIVLAQLWSEHKRKILIITPASLMRQWESELQDKFALPSEIIDRKKYNSLKKQGYSNPFTLKDCIVICSYQMAAISKKEIHNAKFDLCVIDEAHKLRNVWTGKNIISQAIKEGTSNTKKLLLTATPLQNNVMDFYGLSSLIDENLFGDAQIYKEKFQKNYSNNLGELRQRLSIFTHRTLREQVRQYVKFTKRIPKTYSFTQTEDEIKVYEEIRKLLLNSGEESYLIPNKQKHLLLLILCKLMGSSIHSITETLEVMKKRLVDLLNTGEDNGLEVIFDEYEIEDEEIIEENKDQSIDKTKLKAEISNLENIIQLSKSVSIESKYIALKDSIVSGFNSLRNNGSEEKILIFTESRRTQEYIYSSLKKDGFSGVLMFNGSNNDEQSLSIYKEWCEKPENHEKLNNSKSINMRQAIIDYFEETGKILIATGAGAEGLNLQFCSMVINYDLPWNPQVVEQRIGRCHRFGQKHDVIVINFISKNNAIEQRIYELLSTKFRVFNEIFGSSDSILGTLEDGVDLQKSIIEIYTKCRTIEEINEAFDNLQSMFKDEIDESIAKTKKELLENFDEDIQTYFSDILDNTKRNINEIEKKFWILTKIILNNKATFNNDDKTFLYEDNLYSISKEKNNSSIEYNMATKLGKEVIKQAANINNKYGKVIFDITNYPFKISNINDLKGRKGFISLSKLSIESFETEDHLFFDGYLDNGEKIDEDTIEKMFRLETTEKILGSISKEEIDRVLVDSKLHANKILLLSEERNNEILNNEIQKINHWAEDKIESVQLTVENLRNERKNLQKQSDIAESFLEKKKIEEEILKISKKIKASWIELADAEDAIEEERVKSINKLRSELMKKNTLDNIFVIEFEVV